MIEQRSDEWHALRRGRITASKFKAVMTDPRTKADKESGKLSATASTYIYDLLAELATGESKQFTSRPTDHGIEYEPDAIATYARVQKIEPIETGFIISDANPLIGCSPDFLVGDDGGGECKCPYDAANHIRYFCEGLPKEHTDQIRGTLYALNRKWWDFVSYSPFVGPELSLFVERVYRDELYERRFAAKLGPFIAQYQEMASELGLELPAAEAIPHDCDIAAGV